MSPEARDGSEEAGIVARTELGRLTHGDALSLLGALPDASVSLAVSSVWFTGPFAMTVRDPTAPQVGAWLAPFMAELERVLAPRGSVVLEMGCTWADDAPARTIQNYTALGQLLAGGPWHLLQEFYWYNPQLLYERPEWVDKRRIRFHDSISTFYWLATDVEVDVDTARVANFRTSFDHPGGNLLGFTDTVDDVAYLDDCVDRGVVPYIDRFPVSAPRFFVELLTHPGDLVVDPFCGIGSTAVAAEGLSRRWCCGDHDESLVRAAARRIERLA